MENEAKNVVGLSECGRRRRRLAHHRHFLHETARGKGKEEAEADFDEDAELGAEDI